LTVVRAASVADAGAIAAIYAPYVSDGVASFEAEPPAAAELGARMGAPPRLPWLVAEEAGAVLGYAYASRHRARAAYRWSADVSVYVAPDAHGRGVGRALYEQLIPEVRALGYVCAFAGITLPNAASVGLHEAMGFVPVGVFRDVGFKFGAWRDVGWWRLQLREPPAEPDEPREWQAPRYRPSR
jgi:phosphinothricin acetyltransferase